MNGDVQPTPGLGKRPPFFRALIWMRWRMMVNGLRGRRKRDALERLSRLMHVIAPVLLVLLMIPGLVLSAVGGAAAGWFVAADGGSQVPALTILRVALLIVTIFAFLSPIFVVLRGTSYSHARLLLLPIPRWRLYAGEVISRLSDPGVLLLLPGLFCFPLGLLAHGAVPAAVTGLAAGAWLLAVLLVGQALVSFAIGLLLRDRRRGELVTIAVFIFASTAGLVSSIVGDKFERRVDDRPATERATERPIPRALPVVAALVPSELHVQAVQAALERRPLGVAWRFGIALLVLGGLNALARSAHGRLLEQPEGGGRRRRRAAVPARAWRVPGVRPAVAAIAAAHARASRRSLQGKIALLFPSLFSLLLVLALSSKLDRLPADFPIPPQVLLASGVAMLCLLMLQQELINLFARDGAGLTLQLVQPVTDRELVLGKLLGAAVLLFAGILPAFAIAAVVLRDVPPHYWACLLAIVVASYLWLAPLGAILSAVLPKKVDPSKFQNRPHQGAALVSMLAALLLTGLPVSAALLVTTFAGPWPALGLTLLWTAVSTAAGLVLAGTAADLVTRRRENLALVVQGS